MRKLANCFLQKLTNYKIFKENQIIFNENYDSNAENLDLNYKIYWEISKPFFFFPITIIILMKF